eukprot:PhF_6_TR12246/c0_g1_i2/m.19392
MNTSVLPLLLVTTLLLFATTPTNATVSASFTEGELPKKKEFAEPMQCPLCLAYASALRSEMLRTQPPPLGGSWTEERRKKYIAREDRSEEVMMKAAEIASSNYIFVDERKDGVVVTGRYWHHDALKRMPNLSDDSRKEMETQKKHGGHSPRSNFLYVHVIGKLEDEIEGFVQKNVTDINALRNGICVEGTNLCKGDISPHTPRDEL